MKSDNLNEYWCRFIDDNDLDSLSKIYFHFYNQLFTYGLKFTSDKQLVEDSIQNIFLNFIKWRKTIGIVTNLTGYLISSFRRQLFTNVNNQNKTVLMDQVPECSFDYFKTSEDEISDWNEVEELDITIRRCIDNLTAKQREIIYLRFESRISYEEISEMLNISVESCYKSVYRSIKIIRLEAEKMLKCRDRIFFWFWLGQTRWN